jgi:hypothetical protein
MYIFVSVTMLTVSHFMDLMQPQTFDSTTYSNQINRKMLTTLLSLQVMTCV